MLTPAADAVFVGGASVVLIIAWMILKLDLTSPNTMQRFVFINFLINAPHFMASYKLLYGARDKRRDYPGVTWWVPAVLVLWSVVGLATYGQSRLMMQALFGASVVSLSWHYTGQTWGMMASFAHIQGLGFTPTERRLIRANLWTLAAFHIAWAVIVVRKIFAGPGTGEPLLSAAQGDGLYQAIAALALGSSVLGLAGLGLWWQRVRRAPPLRVWVPWLAVHLWYWLLYREPTALFWVQNAHALQYLLFPMRVELNRDTHAGRGTGRMAVGLRMVRYYGVIVAAGLAVLWALPWLLRNERGAVGLAGLPVELTLISCVNLHHYFIDGVIWKIRNPVVRRDLFSHLAAARS